MTPRRKQTAVRAEQPVRFYKVIALTFLFLTIILLAVIVFMSSKRAAIIIESKSTPINAVTKVNIGDEGALNAIAGVLKTVTVSRSERYMPTGTREEPGIAVGTVIIHNETDFPQPLVRTTRLLTPDGVLFRIDKGVVVPANGSVSVEAYADKEGESGNIGPSKFTIPGLRKDKQKVIYAISKNAMSGGIRTVGVLNNEDIKKAEKRLLALLEEDAKKELLEEKTDYEMIFSVVQSVFEPNAEVGEEVSEFELTGQATILGVFYDGNELQKIALEQLVKRAVDDTEIIEAVPDSLSVFIEDYDIISGEAQLKVSYDGVAVLNPESKQLKKDMFFGKTRDEVRRYILKLDHVSGVDIKFTPAWMQTVPHIGDHVNVVVKNVE